MREILIGIVVLYETHILSHILHIKNRDLNHIVKKM